MSESMAFIGGVAVAGLAALLLLKGTNNPVQSFAVPSQIQQPQVVAPPALPQQGQYPFPAQNQPAVSRINSDSPLRTDMERLKLQLNDLQKTNDQLKNQNQQLQTQLQNNYQQQINALSAQNSQASSPQSALTTNQPWWSSGIVWAVGGVIVTVGGGIVVAGISALFSQKQRPTRTVQVIHPYNSPVATPIGPVRRAEFLPPRAESRRVESSEYEDMY
ncbi:MAG: heterocyst differentiation related protein [Cyanobacteria bacterium P01_A01_bin.84]